MHVTHNAKPDERTAFQKAKEEALPPPSNAYDLCCQSCPRVLKIPELTISFFKTQSELYAHLSLIAEANGWGHGGDWVMDNYCGVFTCPVCLKRPTDLLEKLLPKFSIVSLCAACGEGQAEVEHCRGLSATCMLGVQRDHLHRTCRRCGLEWIEGRLDDPRAT